MLDNNLANESILCQSCGLCCQGQLYSWVSLLPEEISVAKTWSIEIVTRENSVGFRQPCACFQKMRCSVYPQRPRTCVEYRCRLLQDLRINGVSLPDATRIVSQARELFHKIEALLPESSNKGIWQRISERWELENLHLLLASGELTPATLMAIVTLDVFLKKYFRHKRV